jgi:hypothetical protein
MVRGVENGIFIKSTLTGGSYAEMAKLNAKYQKVFEVCNIWLKLKFKTALVPFKWPDLLKNLRVSKRKIFLLVFV